MRTPDRFEQLQAFRLLVAALDAVGVDYALTGGLAVSFFVEPRLTRDVDVIIDPSPGDHRDLVRVLAEDFDIDAVAALAALAEKTPFNVITRHTLVKIDLVPRRPEHDREDVFARRVVVEVEGTQAQVLAPEDLIVAKLWWAKDSHSPKQLRDVQELLHAEGVDTGLIERRVARLGLGVLLNEAKVARYD